MRLSRDIYVDPAKEEDENFAELADLFHHPSSEDDDALFEDYYNEDPIGVVVPMFDDPPITVEVVDQAIDEPPIDKPVVDCLIGPVNLSNSCFVDSVLVALFYDADVFVTTYILEATLKKVTKSTQLIFGDDATTDLKQRRQIQKHLQKFCDTMRMSHVRKCRRSVVPTTLTEMVTTLRQLVSSGKLSGSNFANGQQHDAAEFLAAIASVFHLQTNVNKRLIQISGTNDLLTAVPTTQVVTSTREEEAGITHHVFDWSPETTTSSCLENVSDSGILDRAYCGVDGAEYNRYLTVSKFIPSIFFIVHIDRTLRTAPQVDKTSFIVEERLMANGRYYNLMSIVLHNGQSVSHGHYTALICLKQKWHHYDDAKGYVVPVEQEHFHDIDRRYNVGNHAVLLFYSS